MCFSEAVLNTAIEINRRILFVAFNSFACNFFSSLFQNKICHRNKKKCVINFINSTRQTMKIKSKLMLTIYVFEIHSSFFVCVSLCVCPCLHLKEEAEERKNSNLHTCNTLLQPTTTTYKYLISVAVVGSARNPPLYDRYCDIFLFRGFYTQ